MMSRPTKADLERVIADMRAAQSAADRLINAVADVVASPDGRFVRHMFFRADATAVQISLDMQERSQ